MTSVPASSRPVIDAENPWPGLSAFDEGAHQFFRGRDAEAGELLRLVGQGTLTVLFGKSGLGKTSLLNAGLFPRLREQNILPVYVRLDVRATSPLIDQAAAALSAEVVSQRVEEVPPDPDTTLWQRLHGRTVQWWSPRNQPLIPLFVFDQFEEVFTLGAESPAAVERLRLDLADLIENRIPAAVAQRIDEGVPLEHLDLRIQRYKVLLSFREDFLPDVEGWKGELPSVMRNRLRLVHMSADQALQVVLGETPTGRTHELVTPETARDIVRFVGEVQGGLEGAAGIARARPGAERPWSALEIEPALLSLVCHGLNESRKRRSRPAIDAALLKETGRTILGDFYDRALLDVPPSARRFIENQLITEGGFRNSYPVHEALDQKLLTEPVLQRLVDRRLLRIEHQLGADRVELIHDRLTDIVREHRDRERERRLARRQNLVRAAVAAAFLVLAVVAGVFVILWNNADDARRSAETAERQAQAAFRDALAPKLVARSRHVFERVREGGTDLALLLAAAAFRVSAGNDSYVGLSYALNATRDLSKVAMLPDPIVALSPDGRTAVTARWNELSLWDAATGERRGDVMTSVAVGPPHVFFSPDGRRIATFGIDDPVPVRIWDAATGRPDAGARLGPGAAGFVSAVAFSPDGKTLAIAGEDLTVRLVDLATGTERLAPMRGHSGTVRTLAFSPDARYVASGGDDTAIIVWDARTGGVRLGPLKAQPSPIRAVEFSPDSRLLLARNLNTDVQVRDLADGGRIRLTAGFSKSPGAAFVDLDTGVGAATFGWDSGTLVLVTELKDILMLDSRSGQEVRRIVSPGDHTVRIQSLAVNRAAQMVVSSDSQQSVMTWSFQRALGSTLLPGAAAEFAFSPDGTTLAGVDVSDPPAQAVQRPQSIKIWNLDTMSAAPVAAPRGGFVRSIALTRGGREIVIGTLEGTLTVVETATGVIRAGPWKVHPEGIRALAVSQDGRFIAASGYPAKRSASADDLWLWDLAATPPRRRSLGGHAVPPNTLAFSPDGQYLVSGVFAANRPSVTEKLVTLRMWDTATGKHVPSDLDAHAGPVSAIVFSPTGRFIAAGADRPQVWDLRSPGREPRALIGASSFIAAMAFSPGEETVALTDQALVQFWDTATGELRSTGSVEGRPGRIVALSFTADGRSIRDVHQDSTLHVKPAPLAWIDEVCSKVVRNLSEAEWTRHIGDLEYIAQCPGLPVPPPDAVSKREPQQGTGGAVAR